MKKIFTIIAAILVLHFAVIAQSPYLLTSTTASYTALSGATSANGTTPWHVQYFSMPLGFSAKFGNTMVTRLYTDGAVLYADTMGTAVDLFQSFYSHTIDPGFGTATSQSPLRYMTTGSAPNRIFKYEVSGGRFYAEKQTYGTYADSFNYQVWVYEGSNNIEMHFGSSKISHAVDYFGLGGYPSFCGYFNVNFSTGVGNIGYFAAGAVATPFIDSFTAMHNPVGLYNYPPSGTVFKFSPRTSTTGIANIGSFPNVYVYPTVCNNNLFVDVKEGSPIDYRIVSLTGAVMMEGALQTGNNSLGVNRLAPGMYLLQLQSVASKTTYRFVKQ